MGRVPNSRPALSASTNGRSVNIRHGDTNKALLADEDGGLVTSDILDREPRQDPELSPSWDTEAANTQVINNTGH